MSRRPASLAVALAAVFSVSFYAYGQLGGPDGVRIPFTGLLQHNNVSQSGLFDFRFSIYNAPTGDACDTHEETTMVSAGRFSVILGPVDQACVRGEDVYVGVEVSDDKAVNGYTALPGRQRVYSASSAVSSGSGDFAVEGALSVGGNTTLGGSLFQTTEGAIAQLASSATGTRGVEVRWNLSGGNGETDLVSIHKQGGVGGFDFFKRGTDNQNRLLARITSDGNISASGNLSASGDLSVGGRVEASGNVDVVGTVQRTEYQTSCASGLFNFSYQYCCRIDVRTGVAACKTGGVANVGWSAIESPFPAAGTDGPYSLSCNEHVSSNNFPMCCRTGSDGSVDCMRNEQFDMTGSWVSAGSPW